MTKKQKRIPEICVYCEVNVATTRDHVIPKCLFISPLPSNMVTVPVCTSCNLKKSKEEDYLRDMLTIDFNVSQHPIAEQIFKTKVLNSVKRNSSAVARSAILDGKFISMFTKSGIYVGQYRSFSIDGQRIIDVFTFIVRGLYYKLTKKRLPKDTLFEVGRLDIPSANEIALNLLSINCNGPYRLGDGVFSCVFVYDEEDPTVSFWLLWFYNNVFISVSTENKF